MQLESLLLRKTCNTTSMNIELLLFELRFYVESDKCDPCKDQDQDQKNLSFTLEGVECVSNSISLRWNSSMALCNEPFSVKKKCSILFLVKHTIIL